MNYFVITLLIIFILIYILYNPSKNNITALSYVNTKYDIPKYELIHLFINKYNDEKYEKYINNILSLKLLIKPVYCIKKMDNNYEYEIYFYRYDENRQSNFIYNFNYNILNIKLSNYFKTFPTNDQLKEMNINLYKNKLFIDNLEYIEYKKKNNINFDDINKEFIIVSYDVNENFFKSDYHKYNYYYYNSDNLPYTYFIKEEDIDGNIIETNKYNLFYCIFKSEDKDKFLVNEFECDECVIFYAYKPIKNLHAIYYENLSYYKFIYFLEYFKYDNDIIEFCNNNYNNNYRFCISYDMNNIYQVIKSGIFSILEKNYI
jgi:hypothetical protein